MSKPDKPLSLLTGVAPLPPIETTSESRIYSADLKKIRSQFPALDGTTIYLENAGGSQVPRCVAESIADYMLNNYVQLGAGYEISKISTNTVDLAHAWMNRFVNGENAGSIILGSSTTALCRILAECYAPILKPGDEIILAQTAHEANYGPWKNMAERINLTIRIWPVNPETQSCELADLDHLLNHKTRLIAFPLVSNLLGEIVDVKEITRRAHAVGAEVVVDGVAYAPHRAVNVRDWNVDWFAFSNYKVYGPHIATLFGKHEAIEKLTGPNHFFIPPNEIPYKFEPGGVSHESCAGLLALREYLEFVGSLDGSSVSERDENDLPSYETITRAFDLMTECELPVQQKLIKYLKDQPDVTIIGPNHADSSRVPTISFTHETKSAIEIVDFVDRNSTIGIRFGHMYAYHLCKALNIDLEAGVTRVSATHYNTTDEIDQLITCLDRIL